MTQNRKPKHMWLKYLVETLLLIIISLIILVFFVAWIAAKSGAPVPAV